MQPVALRIIIIVLRSLSARRDGNLGHRTICGHVICRLLHMPRLDMQMPTTLRKTFGLDQSMQPVTLDMAVLGRLMNQLLTGRADVLVPEKRLSNRWLGNNLADVAVAYRPYILVQYISPQKYNRI